jgi:hypothetical protein
MTETNSKVAFDSMIQSYLDSFNSTNKRKVPELEVRFGTGNVVRPTTKIDSDNVVKQLLRAGLQVIIEKDNIYCASHLIQLISIKIMNRRNQKFV